MTTCIMWIPLRMFMVLALRDPTTLPEDWAKGKGIYCLDVTHAADVPTDNSVGAADIFNWEYTDSADVDLGYVFGRAYVVNTTAGPTVIFGNGYGSTSR